MQPMLGQAPANETLAQRMMRQTQGPSGFQKALNMVHEDARIKKENDPEEIRKKALAAAAQQAGDFANQGQAGYGAMTAEMAQDRANLRALASGQNSVSAEQLRQGMLGQQAAQMSMAAGAAPQNQAMAARSAMNNMGRAGYGMSGQAALAGLQERNAAMQQLGQLNLGQRGQDANIALGSRQNELTGLQPKPKDPKEPSTTDKLLAGAAAFAPIAFSDKRLKTNVKDGDKAARRALEALSAKTYSYKSERHGKGSQLGVLAQDIERFAPDAIIETPEGKAIHAGKLSGANSAMIAALGRRVQKLERGK